jgi:U4/U6 small nuclear ribonucleoprotein PRP4
MHSVFRLTPSTVNLATGGADDKVHLWSLASPDKPLRTLGGHLGRINNVAFHPHHPWMGSTSHDKTWILWDIETGTRGGFDWNSFSLFLFLFLLLLRLLSLVADV